MPGPAKKPAHLRQRRNKKKTIKVKAKTESTPKVPGKKIPGSEQSERGSAPAERSEAPTLPERECRCVRGMCQCWNCKENFDRRREEEKQALKKNPKEPSTGPMKPCSNCDDKGKVKYHPHTIKEWNDLWENPQAKQYVLALDKHGLARRFNIVDRINWHGADAELEDVRELRMLDKEFGLTPWSRRGLQWEQAPEIVPDDAAGVDEEFDEVDPREVLRLVKSS